MPQETKAIFHRTEQAARQGLQATADDPEALRKAIELALDYRGDVTITLQGPAAEEFECFIFDVKHGNSDAVLVRAIPKNRDEKISIPFDNIGAITFTGRDTAAGRSFETWMKNFVKKKLAGEEASIHTESLE